MNNIIEVRNLSKCFKTLTERTTLFRFFKRVFSGSKHYKEIWALKNVDFEMKKGEKIGIIGDNGSGKTTLLRIISGIYKQTTGDIAVNGKMSGFLQCGAGVERELSALDNIFLFGAIIGLDRATIKKRLDAIINFSKLEDFIYLPLKDFSMGMIQRLSISILKEMALDIVFLDDILVGGDASFREKCFEVFKGYKEYNKSLILSSHDMDLVVRVCDNVLLLDNGRQVAFGPAREIVNIYNKHKF